ncbi:MAG TPA: hypothetical protein VIF84_10570 [Candidatus Limnocylindrales bacterium]
MIVDRRRRERIQRAVLDWFAGQARTFEFRGLTDPYAILVSEVILQQTQAGRGEPAWRSFMARFPTVAVLAAASPADVLRQWSGLGYNRRAVNLHRAAQAIVERHDGLVPDDLGALQALPGIGPYTARAVAAIAFGQAVGPVDTNVRRVLGRVVVGHGDRRDLGRALTATEVQALADDLVPRGHAADWTAALMDIGATRCRPARADCTTCPLEGLCRYASERDSDHRAPRARARPAHRVAEPGSRYASTRRWLRGRIMVTLADADDEAWVVIRGPIGDHDAASVDRALDGLAAEGMAESDGRGRWRLPGS